MTTRSRFRSRRWRLGVAGLLAGIATTLVVPLAQAAPGEGDPGFGDGGVAVVAWPHDDPTEAMGVDAVAVGDKFASMSSDVAGVDFGDGVPSHAWGSADAGLVVGEAGGDFGVMKFAGGSLDPAFGDHGRLRIPFGGPAVARAAFPAFNNGYGWVIAGTARIKGSSRIALARIDDWGRLDPEYGNGGIATFDVGPGDDEAFAVKKDNYLASAGGLVVGRSGGAAVVVSVGSNGQLNKDFGVGGVLRIDPTLGDDVAFGVGGDAYHTVVAGRAGSRSFVAELGSGANGLNPDYGTNGVTVFDLGGPVSEARTVGNVAGGVLVAGTTGVPGSRNGAITRITSYGAVDPRYGTSGVTVADFGGDDRVNAMKFAGDAGAATMLGGDGRNLVSWSVDANGVTTGIAGGERSSYDRAMDITEGPGGRVIVSAMAGAVPGLAALGPDGRADGSFGDGGTVKNPLASGWTSAVAALPDGRILVAGGGALHRYTADGRPDPTFGDHGSTPGSAAGTPGSLLVEPDGRIVVVGKGSTDAHPGAGMWIGRYLPDGRPDPSFGGNGAIVVDSYDFGAQAVVRDADGSYVLVGRRFDWYSRGIALVRVRPNGYVDPNFNFSTYEGVATTLTSMPDGGYVLGGSADGGYGGDHLQLIRLDHDGRLVPSFGDGGYAVLTGDGLSVQAVDLAADAAGRILVAANGWTDPGSESAAAVLRVLGDGQPDETFGDGGVVALGDVDTLSPVALHLTDHGRLYAAGTTRDDGDVVVFALSADGSVGGPGQGSGQGAGGGAARGSGDPGYWMIDGGGAVYAFGTARYHGRGPGGEAVDLEPTPSGEGYWITDARGTISALGDARDFGGVGPGVLAAGETVASLSATPSGAGYWLFTNRGRVIARGDAGHYGDLDGIRLNGPVLGSIPTPSGRGYYMVASDGGIFAFGDATFRGSMGGTKLNRPVVGLVPDGDGAGYWLVASDGGVFAFDAPFRGSLGAVKLNRPIVGMVRYGNGYLMVGSDGGVFTFSDLPFAGSLGDHPPARPVVAIAPAP